MAKFIYRALGWFPQLLFVGSIIGLVYVFFYTRWDLWIYRYPLLLVPLLAAPLVARIVGAVVKKVREF